MTRCAVCGAPIKADQRICQLCATKRLSIVPDPLAGGHKSNTIGEDPVDAETGRYSRVAESEVCEVEEENTGEFVLGQGHRRSRQSLKGTDRLSFAVLEGKYRLFEEVGRGAMGTVFRAEDISLKREVAVKFLLPELARTRNSAEQFRREAAGMAAIRHHNVAQVYAYGRYGKIPYFTMEYLDGESAEELVDKHNKRGIFLPLGLVLDILVQALNGLAAIHRSGAVHRDIKPANIMLVGEPMRAVITDFGLARQVRFNEKLKDLTGTPAYIAPELIEGTHGAERFASADVYSMGITAYELVTGSLPFNSDNWMDILRMHVSEIPRLPSERRSGLPAEIDNIILTALSKDPTFRYQRAEEFLEDLLNLGQREMSVEQRMMSVLPPAPSPERGILSPSPPVEERPPREARERPLLKGRLLIADRDGSFREAVHKLVKSSVPGCRIQSVSHGTRALALVAEFKPDVLLVDLALPEINGLELVATLRGDPAFANLNIVVVSEAGGQHEARILSALDVHHFYTKPVDLENLAEIICPLLDRPTTSL